MRERPGTAAENAEREPTHRRYAAALVVVAVILSLELALNLLYGITALSNVGLLGSKHLVLLAGGSLTADGVTLLTGGFALAFALLGLVVLTGILLKQRWAWAIAITWACLTVTLSLVNYFRGSPRYLSMLGIVVFVLALNATSVQRTFAKETAARVPVRLRHGEALCASAGSSDLELLRAFEPVLRFTRGERFFPTDVDRYVGQASLWVRYPDGREEMLAHRGELDLQKLADYREYPFGTVEYLRFNDPLTVVDSARVLREVRGLHKEPGALFRPGVGRLARVGFTPRVVDALFSLSLLLRGRVPPITAAAAELEYHRMTRKEPKHVYYGRVAHRGGWTVLQYWFFYCYNGWRSGYEGANDHEADWENVLVYLYEDDGCLHPEWAGYASHDFKGDDLRRRWDDRDQLALVQGHPVVWVGAGSHASYFRPGEYQARVALPAPRWARAMAKGGSYFWSRVLRQRAAMRDPLRVPFVDYARGDGVSVGPGQELQWQPVLVDESTPWVSGYRGLWGFFANDPTAGENAPAGPMYERNGEPRRSWYDPLGFVGLDKEPPPPAARELLARDCVRMEERQIELERLIDEKLHDLRIIAIQMLGMEGNPSLRARYLDLSGQTTALRDGLLRLQKELAENSTVLTAVKQKQAALDGGLKSDPRAHLTQLVEPVPQAGIRFNRAAEAWGAVSLSLILFGVVALLILARSILWVGLVTLAGVTLLVEAVFRRHYARTVGTIAALLAVFSAFLLLIHFWLWVIIVVLASLAVFLMLQKIRESFN